jgi:hypothetical protein
MNAYLAFSSPHPLLLARFIVQTVVCLLTKLDIKSFSTILIFLIFASVAPHEDEVEP